MGILHREILQDLQCLTPSQFPQTFLTNPSKLLCKIPTVITETLVVGAVEDVFGIFGIWHRPQKFCTPANYIYFDLIVSYLIILTTKFVKLPILWSQISPCRPRKQILLNFFLGLSGRCHHAPAKASSSTPPDIYPPPPERKYENPSLQLKVLSIT